MADEAAVSSFFTLGFATYGEKVMFGENVFENCRFAALHCSQREALRRFLGTEPDLKVIGEALDSAEAVKLVRQLKPDILLLNIRMPKHSRGAFSGRAGVEVLKRTKYPSQLAAGESHRADGLHREERDCRSASAGSQGVVLKDSATQVLKQAIRRVMAGEYWVRREPVSNREQYLRTLMQSTQTTANKRRKLMTSRVFVTMAQVTCGSATHAIEPFSSEFDDLGKANTATTSIRDRSSLKINIEIGSVFRKMNLKLETGNGNLHG